MFSFFRRLIKRQHWHQADAGHLHHRLMRLGHGPRRTVAMLWTWTALLSAVALVPTYTNEGNALVPFVAQCRSRASCCSRLHPGAQEAKQAQERNDHPTGGATADAVVDLEQRRRQRLISVSVPPLVLNGRFHRMFWGILVRFDLSRTLTIDCELFHKQVSGGLGLPGAGRIGKVLHVELRDRQALWQRVRQRVGQAVGDGLDARPVRAFGALLDHWFGTGPVLMLVFGLFGVVGMALRTYYWYQAKIAAEEEGKPWTRSQR